MNPYTLKDGVFLVRGALRGALLDTNSGNVYSINESAVSILTGVTQNPEYWAKLVELGIAETGEATQLEFKPKSTQISLGFVWFEIISDDCNEACIHCYADSMPPAHRAAKGLPMFEDDKPPAAKLSYQKWLELIKEAYELGCRRCQFIGGEPFLYKDGEKTVLDLAAYAKELGFDFVEIFTNATLLTDRKISRIKSLGLNIAVSLYSNDPSVHDGITQTPGSHALTIKNLKLLKEHGVKTRVEMVLMRQNQNTVTETVILIKDIGFSGKTPDPIRPKGRGQDHILSPSPENTVKYGYMVRPNFKADKAKVEYYSSGHSCLAGKITITDKGDILPCIFSRNHIIGNVAEMDLETVLLGSAMQQIWSTTKDSVMVCRDCEYRYVCFDCRPLSEAAARGNADYLHAPYPRCTYNPYTGEWAKGIWKVSETGEPWYDRSVEPVIANVVLEGKFESNEAVSH